MQFLVDCLSCIALLPPQNPLRLFAPRFPERPSRHGSGSALSATGNRLGRTPDPRRCNIDGLRPPTNRMAAYSVQMGFAGADAVPGDLKSLVRGIGAPDLLKPSVSVFAPSMP